jgi:hypothetical protein
MVPDLEAHAECGNNPQPSIGKVSRMDRHRLPPKKKKEKAEARDICIQLTAALSN